MSLPRKLKVIAPLDEDLLAEIEYELTERGVACELNCGGQAITMYVNERSAVFVCQSCKQMIDLASGALRTDLDKKISQIMHSGLLAKSYVHANNASGFQLEELVQQFQQRVKDLPRLEARDAAKQRSEIRKMIAASTTKVGTADDDLLTGRQRNELRARTGQPIKGSQRKTRELKSVPSATLDMPTPSITAAEASLPFPEIELL